MRKPSCFILQVCFPTLTILLINTFVTWAADRYVTPPGGYGTNNPPYANWADAATNIQWAVNAAANGDTVWVTNGTYVLTNQITINSNITICGTGGRPVVDGNNGNRCFYLSSAAPGATLSNLFIMRGTNNYSGGGVYVEVYGNVIDCIFSNNNMSASAGYGYGGGLAIYGGTVRYCTFINNTADRGGGLSIWGTTLVDHCSFQTNIGLTQGGGLQCWTMNNTIITGCDFICNSGPGVFLYDGGGISNIITHCTFVSNINTSVSSSGGGLHQRTAGVGWLVTNCYFSNNIAYAGGGGIGILGATVKNCIIACNIATNTASTGGGGILMGVNSNNLVQDCIIEENQASLRSGGVEYQGGTIRNCLIRNNFASGCTYSYAGGMYIFGAGTISSCTIVSNYASYAGGGIAEEYAIIANFENCIIYFNKCGTAAWSNYYRNASAAASFTNCCLAPALSGTSTNYSTNNIIADPQCIAPASGNYRLSRSSPCVNAGVNRDWMINAFDLDNHRRIDKFSGQVDIGCYEYVPNGTMIKVQ